MLVMLLVIQAVVDVVARLVVAVGGCYCLLLFVIDGLLLVIIVCYCLLLFIIVC